MNFNSSEMRRRVARRSRVKMSEYHPLFKASGLCFEWAPPILTKNVDITRKIWNEIRKIYNFYFVAPQIKSFLFFLMVIEGIHKKKKGVILFCFFFLTWSWWCQKTYSGGSGLNWTIQVRLTWLPTSTWNSGPPKITALGAGSVQKIWFFSQRHTI